MSINFGSIDILITQNLLTHKHGIYLCLFRSSMAFLSMFYKFQHIDIMYDLLNIYLVIYLFEVIVNGIVFLIFGFYLIVQC